MTPNDPFENILHKERYQRGFPLRLCVGALIITAAALGASAAGIQWSAAPAKPEQLHLAWQYVNVATVWTWLLLWPVVALSRERVSRRQLWLDFSVIVGSVAPAIIAAAFLSDVSTDHIIGRAALQLGIGVFALGAISWARRLPPTLIAAFLTSLAVVLPIVGYILITLLPDASHTWINFTPVGSTADTVTSGRPPELGIAAGYALMGIFLLISSSWNLKKSQP